MGGGLQMAVLGLLGLLGLGLAPAGVGGQAGQSDCWYDNYGASYCSGLSYNGVYCQTDPQACEVRTGGGGERGVPDGVHGRLTPPALPSRAPLPHHLSPTGLLLLMPAERQPMLA